MSQALLTLLAHFVSLMNGWLYSGYGRRNSAGAQITSRRLVKVRAEAEAWLAVEEGELLPRGIRPRQHKTEAEEGAEAARHTKVALVAVVVAANSRPATLHLPWWTQDGQAAMLAYLREALVLQ